MTFLFREAWPYLIGVITFTVATHLGLGSRALNQVGLSGWQASLTLLAMLACRNIALPVHLIQAGRKRLQQLPAAVQRALLRLRSPFVDHTTIAISVGGVLIPVGVAVYVMSQNTTNPLDVFNSGSVEI